MLLHFSFFCLKKRIRDSQLRNSAPHLIPHLIPRQSPTHHGHQLTMVTATHHGRCNSPWSLQLTMVTATHHGQDVLASLFSVQLPHQDDVSQLVHREGTPEGVLQPVGKSLPGICITCCYP
eukprot:sb/3476106/